MTSRKSGVEIFGLVAVAMLCAVAFAVLNPSQPTYHGRRLSTWLDELVKPQAENETAAEAFAREVELTNLVLTRTALSTSGAAKSKFLSVISYQLSVKAVNPTRRRRGISRH
jgi:hypothetical protein